MIHRNHTSREFHIFDINYIAVGESALVLNEIPKNGAKITTSNSNRHPCIKNIQFKILVKMGGCKLLAN